MGHVLYAGNVVSAAYVLKDAALRNRKSMRGMMMAFPKRCCCYDDHGDDLSDGGGVEGHALASTLLLCFGEPVFRF